MSLQSELDAFKNAWLERVGPDTAKLVDQDNLALQALAGNALRAGDRFPAIVLKNQLGRGSRSWGASRHSAAGGYVLSWRLVSVL